MKIETRNMILRPWKETDAEALYKYASDPRAGPIAGWPAHTSVENSREIIRDVLSAPNTYALTIRGSDEAVGSIGLFDCTCEECRNEKEIGYWIGVPFWGNGLVPEAVESMLDYCFDWLGSQRVWCGHYKGNDKSKRVIEKCGFTYEFQRETEVQQMNERRMTLFYSISRDRWARRREEQQRRAEATWM